MCFSATASFTAGTFLLGLGLMTVRMARQPREWPFAAIPLLFAIQQLTEGVIWMSFRWDMPMLTAGMTQLYSFFSHVLWPVYVPIAALLIETSVGRRRLLGLVVVGGLTIGLYLLYTLFTTPITARPIGLHIEYDAPHLYAPIVMTFYLSATTVSLLLSSHRMVMVFGVLTLVAAFIAYLFYARWFISVWCFFAALLSVVVCLHFALKNTAPEELKAM